MLAGLLMVLAAAVLVMRQAGKPGLAHARSVTAKANLAQRYESSADAATRTRVIGLYGKLPLSFEANHGQTDGQVKFLSRGAGYALFLTPTEAVLSLHKGDSKPAEKTARPNLANIQPKSGESRVLRIRLEHANPTPQVTGAEQLTGKANYFIGKEPKKWHTDVPTYARVQYEGVYPGVDLVYYGKQGHLEYDFIVAARSEPKQIGLKFSGARGVRLDRDGNLLIDLGDGAQVTEHAPVIYQEVGGERRRIDGGYELRADGRAGFKLGRYDRSQPLVIDPGLVYSTLSAIM